MKKILFFYTATILSSVFNAGAQVMIDHAIILTGSGTNAKLTGIQSATGTQDAASIGALQTGGFTYSDASGSNNSLTLNINPPISSYVKGMLFSFASNQGITGPATLNINSLGARTIKKNINQNLTQCDIQNGQVVTVVYDGANFQMTSVSVPAVPTTANAGPNQVVFGTATLAANTPSIGTGLWTVVSGAGGSLTNAGSPTSTFTGTAGTTYVLSWTVSVSACATSSSSFDTITFATPVAISNLYLWYDANDASTFTYSSGSLVSVWADKSGHGYNASQSVTGNQPTVVANDINGHPAVRFTSGNEDNLTNSAFSMNLANRSVFVVLKENNVDTCYSRIISIRATGIDYSSDNGYVFATAPNGEGEMINNLPSYNILLLTSYSGQGYGCQIPLSIYTDIASSGNGTAYVNGVAQGTGNNPNASTSIGGIALGAGYQNNNTNALLLGSQQLDGDFAELIIYNRALTSTERDEVGAYLSAKWGIPFTP